MAGFDVVVKGARVIDGTGNPWIYGDVAISGDRIAAVEPPGTIPTDGNGQVVEAEGHVVCPGFIDIQSHSIIPLMHDGRSLSKIAQGVTTEIMGEAWTPAPVGGKFTDPFADRSSNPPEGWPERAREWTSFGDWLRAMEAHGVSPNVGSFLGGGTLREYGRGMAMGQSSDDEVAVMRRAMNAAMADGACGVSYALIYPPDAYADTDEIVAICEVVAKHRGVYITHLRSEADWLDEGVAEAVEIGRRTGVAVEIYHLKASGQSNWSKMPGVIAAIDSARAEGVDVTADMYPYPASGTGLAAILPPWASADGKLFENLNDPAMREKVRAEVLNPSGEWEAFAAQANPEGTMPIGLRLAEHKPYVGRRLSEIAADRGQEWIDAALDLLAAERQTIATIYFNMSEDNLRLQLQQPWIKISTDAGGYDPAIAKSRFPTHPRAYGTYTRVLGKYVREEGVIPLEDAIRKMSWSVAQRLNLKDRGILRPGAYADVVILDPGTVADKATFEDPHQLSVGIRDVWVNGARVMREGAHTGATPGRFVRPGA